jgi:hypothetical protein
MTLNALKSVNCEHCSASLMRRPINPNTGNPIVRFFCGFACKGAWQRTQKPVSEEWLRQKYLIDGLNCVQIAKIVRRNPKRVWEWLRDLGLETRGRGSDLSRQWRDGERRHPGGFPHSEETKNIIRQHRLRDGRVPYLTKNGSHYMRGRRGAAHHGWKGGLTPEREATASTHEWKEAVKAVWARADAKCERCGTDYRSINREKLAFDIHHIISFQHRPTRTVVDNLVLLCEPCHYWVHSKRNVDRSFLGEPVNA